MQQGKSSSVPSGGWTRCAQGQGLRSSSKILGRPFGAIGISSLGAIAFTLAGCLPSYFNAEEERGGILLDWGTQTDRAGLEELLQECETSVGFGFKAGAAIKFVGDANHHCNISKKKQVAGCWIQDFDLIVLEPAPRLAETAICHELLHRQLFERRSDPDYGHVSPEWSALAAGLAKFRQPAGGAEHP